MGSVFSYADSGIDTHASFNIDYGYGIGGMQGGRGHRMGTMSLKKLPDGSFGAGDYYNVGVAIIPENDPDTRVGSLVVTENFARAVTTEPDHYNRFIVGTVWEDNDGDGIYASGDGIDNVTVTPVGGAFYAVTPPSGGYAMPITSEGQYDVLFTGGDIPYPITHTVIVENLSVLVDVKTGPDTDGDHLPDSYEQDHFQSLTASDGSQDADQDGLIDADEYRWLTNPNNPHSDGDLMPDGWEVFYFLNPIADDGNGDKDFDNFSNEAEYRSKSDPSVYTIVMAGDFNQNGKLDLADALFSLQADAGIYEVYTYPIYDMNGDGKFGLSDGLQILKEVSGNQETP